MLRSKFGERPAQPVSLEVELEDVAARPRDESCWSGRIECRRVGRSAVRVDAAELCFDLRHEYRDVVRVMMEQRGSGKSHIMALVHHAFGSPG